MNQPDERSVPGFDSAFSAFLRDFPAWSTTAILDELRTKDYGRLDLHSQVYLDYTGGGLYSESQLQQHRDLLSESVFGNPHSNNPTSQAMTERVESARSYVLQYFNAPSDDYIAIFTQNASGALKLAGESYPFGSDDRFLLTFDNHNSVNGIREFARTRGADTTYVPVFLPDMRVDRAAITAQFAIGSQTSNRLFAFPAQSNFTGVQHSLDLIEEAHDAGWDVLLDAAAFVPTNRLDVDQWKPDLVALSFYKMFGYPTGVGCLLMRKSMQNKLIRPWFAGGTIRIASVQGDRHYLAHDAAAFEDGTVDYLNLPAVEIGLRHLSTIGVDVIHERVSCLTGWLLAQMAALHHSNGEPLVQLHGPTELENRGGTIAFNLIDPVGEDFDIRAIEMLASEAQISLRTGCFCNPGAGEITFGLTAEEIAHYFAGNEGMTFDELRARIRETFGKEIGAIRISVGIASTFADVYRFLDFAREFIDRTAEQIGVVEFEGCGRPKRDGA